MIKKFQKYLTDLISKYSLGLIVYLIPYPLAVTGILSLKDKLLIQTPLWLVLLLLLSIILCYQLLFLFHSRKPSKKPPYKIEYFTIGDYKWKTRIHNLYYFEVEEYPYCIEHDTQFILRKVRDNWEKYCPIEKCNKILKESDQFKIHESTKSMIEKILRDKKLIN